MRSLHSNHLLLPSASRSRVSAPASGTVRHHEWEQMQAQCDRLQEQLDEAEERCEQLQAENEALRREATLVRLYDDLVRREPEQKADTDGSSADDPGTPFAIPDTLPAEAIRLYRMLPLSFTIPVFFERASALDLTDTQARRCLLYFLRQQHIAQTGRRFRKAS